MALLVLLCLALAVCSVQTLSKRKTLLEHGGPVASGHGQSSNGFKEMMKSAYAPVPFRTLPPRPRESVFVAITFAFREINTEAPRDVINSMTRDYISHILLIARPRIGTSRGMVLPGNNDIEFILKKIKEDMLSNPKEYESVYRQFPGPTNAVLPFDKFVITSGTSTVQMLFRMYWDMSNWSFIARHFAPAAKIMRLVHHVPKSVSAVFSKFTFSLKSLVVFVLSNHANNVELRVFKALSGVFRRLPMVFSRLSFLCEQVTFLVRDYISFFESDAPSESKRNALDGCTKSINYIKYRHLQEIMKDIDNLPKRPPGDEMQNSIMISDQTFTFPSEEQFEIFLNKIDAFSFAFRDVLELLKTELFFESSPSSVSVSAFDAVLERVVLFAPRIDIQLTQNSVIFNILGEILFRGEVRQMLLDALLFSDGEKDQDVIRNIRGYSNEPREPTPVRDISIFFSSQPWVRSLWHRFMFFPYIKSSIPLNFLYQMSDQSTYSEFRESVKATSRAQLMLLNFLQIDDFDKLKQAMPVFYSLFHPELVGTLRDNNRAKVPVRAIQEYVSMGFQNADSMKKFLHQISSSAFTREVVAVLKEILLVGFVFLPPFRNDMMERICYNAPSNAKRPNILFEVVYNSNRQLVESFPEAMEAVKTFSNVWTCTFIRIVNHLDMLLWLNEVKPLISY